MTRISVLVGVFERLHRLFADEITDRWPALPNKGSLFAGRSPIATMIEDGVPQMLRLRDYVDELLG